MPLPSATSACAIAFNVIIGLLLTSGFAHRYGDGTLIKILRRRRSERRIPPFQCGLSLVVAEDTERGGSKQKVAARRRWHSNPARRQYPEQMAVPEESGTSVGCAQLGNHAIDARSDIFRALAARTAVAKDHPARPARAYFLRREALVLPIVPFHQVEVDLRHRSKARQPARLSSALQRTGQDECELRADEKRLELA